MTEHDIDVKKIAEWAGFTYYDNPIVFGPGTGEKSGWYFPDGTVCWGSPPDFPNDLNACMEYLEPKLHNWELMKEFHPNDTTTIYCWCSTLRADADANDVTAALAFYKAVDNLIDWEAKQNAE